MNISPQTQQFAFNNSIIDRIQNTLFLLQIFQFVVDIGNCIVSFEPDIFNPGHHRCWGVLVIFDTDIRTQWMQRILLSQNINKMPGQIFGIQGIFGQSQIDPDQGIFESSLCFELNIWTDFRFRLHIEPVITAGKHQYQAGSNDIFQHSFHISFHLIGCNKIRK